MKKLLLLLVGLIICQQAYAEKLTGEDLDFIDKVDDGIGYMKTIREAIKADNYSDFREMMKNLEEGQESETIAEAEKKLVKLDEFVDHVKQAAWQLNYADFKKHISMPLIRSGSRFSTNRRTEYRAANKSYNVLHGLIKTALREDTFERFILKMKIIVIAA